MTKEGQVSKKIRCSLCAQFLKPNSAWYVQDDPDEDIGHVECGRCREKMLTHLDMMSRRGPRGHYIICAAVTTHFYRFLRTGYNYRNEQKQEEDTNN